MPSRHWRSRQRSHSIPRLVALVAATVLGGPGLALGQTWTSTSSGNWSVAGNWTALPTSGTTTALTFGGSTAYTATNDIGSGTFQLNRLTVSNTGATTIAAAVAANTLSFAGTNPALVINAGAGATTISNGLTYGIGTAITNNAGTLLTLGGIQAFGTSTTVTISNTGAGGGTAPKAPRLGPGSCSERFKLVPERFQDFAVCSQPRRLACSQFDRVRVQEWLDKHFCGSRGSLQLLIDDALMGTVLVDEVHPIGRFDDDIGQTNLTEWSPGRWV